MAGSIYDQLDRELKILARARSTAKRAEERIATLVRALRDQDGGQAPHLPEPKASNDAREEMLALVRKGLQNVGYVPKLRR